MPDVSTAGVSVFEHTDTAGWVETWDAFEALGAQVVIPGHGDSTDMDEVTRYNDNRVNLMENYAFSLELGVRDYECDIQGIVNNGVYQNYLEHVRHEYLKFVGIDFADYARRGINLVVVRAELDYKLPLTSGDRFVVGLNLVRESKARFAFHQDIYRLPDEKPVMKAKVIGTALNERGRPSIPEELDGLLVTTTD